MSSQDITRRRMMNLSRMTGKSELLLRTFLNFRIGLTKTIDSERTVDCNINIRLILDLSPLVHRLD